MTVKTTKTREYKDMEKVIFKHNLNLRGGHRNLPKQ